MILLILSKYYICKNRMDNSSSRSLRLCGELVN
jgi:hypothetical protein